MGKETIGINIWLFVAGLVLWTVVQSCEMKEATSNENVKPVGHYEENEYNSDFSDFARVVSEALKSDKDFRYMVRDEALQGIFYPFIKEFFTIHIPVRRNNSIFTLFDPFN